MKKISWTVWLLCGLVAVPAMAQETAKPAAPPASAPGTNGSANGAPAEQGEAAPAKRVTVATGFDFATAYLFRGIFQEDQGTIVPPYVDVGLTVYQGQGALKSVTLNGGNWNSLHSGPTGGGGQGNAWYEADYYGSVTMAVGNWKPGALFTSYTSPNDVFKTVHELAGVLAYDDSRSPFPLAPRGMVAFELQGQADGGARKGIYLELGVRPSVPLIRGKAPLSLAFPVKAGFSLKDYYESPDGNSQLGYVDTGIIASIAVPMGKTTWDIHGGVDFLWLGDSNTRLNGGDRSKPVGIIGIGITY